MDYYGAITPLRQIAGISAPDAQSLVIQPYDVSAMPNIEKAISKSDLGVTPSNDGKIIRINIPSLTKVVLQGLTVRMETDIARASPESVFCCSCCVLSAYSLPLFVRYYHKSP